MMAKACSSGLNGGRENGVDLLAETLVTVHAVCAISFRNEVFYYNHTFEPLVFRWAVGKVAVVL